MICNGKDYQTHTVLQTDVCIIGSGPAGVTAAWHLQKAGVKVILIEGSRPVQDYVSGYSDSWPDKVLLYNGVAEGLFKENEPDFLYRPYGDPNNPETTNPGERERVFGGTSNHWGGQCRPLDPITFEERPGFPAWPIKRTDLDQYYEKAAAFCGLTNNFTTEYWAGQLGAQIPQLAGFDVEMYQFNNINFATQNFEGETTIRDSAAEVILNASLLSINLSGGSVSSISVASMNDDPKHPKPATEFTIKASAFVLACGAVANARQLLLSNVGNEHDKVGRYFMCHPIPKALDDPRDPNNKVVRISKKTSILEPDEQKIMSGTSSAGVYVEARFSPTDVQQKKLGIGSCWFVDKSNGYYFEVAPNPESRVTLADTVDPVFGQPQTKITWKLSDTDQTTYEQTTKLFQAVVESRGASVAFATWEELRKRLVINGHHIGTTRMSLKPEDGVVDANLKVHSVKNLYVAGASVYASAGISNPTFTVITLSIRLAEHLKGALGHK